VIDTVLLDIDGILTDGAVYVDSSGKETKRILFDDIDAIFELKRAGVKIGFITGEDNEFCRYVKKRFTPDFFATGCNGDILPKHFCNFNLQWMHNGESNTIFQLVNDGIINLLNVVPKGNEHLPLNHMPKLNTF